MPAVNVRRWGWADPNPGQSCQQLDAPGSITPLESRTAAWIAERVLLEQHRQATQQPDWAAIHERLSRAKPPVWWGQDRGQGWAVEVLLELGPQWLNLPAECPPTRLVDIEEPFVATRVGCWKKCLRGPPQTPKQGAARTCQPRLLRPYEQGLEGK